jgi:hypothetical protein
MAAETQEALKEQEKRLGLLIGRLEVGTARRQAILSKQDATLQNLQVGRLEVGTAWRQAILSKQDATQQNLQINATKSTGKCYKIYR